MSLLHYKQVAVSAVQKVLKDAGYLEGKITGEVDAVFTEAWDSFSNATHGLKGVQWSKFWEWPLHLMVKLEEDALSFAHLVEGKISVPTTPAPTSEPTTTEAPTTTPVPTTTPIPTTSVPTTTQAPTTTPAPTQNPIAAITGNEAQNGAS